MADAYLLFVAALLAFGCRFFWVEQRFYAPSVEPALLVASGACLVLACLFAWAGVTGWRL